MFTFNAKNRLSRLAGIATVVSVMSVSSFAANANESLSQEAFKVLEQSFSKASYELMNTAKNELMLSLQTQIAEQVFDINTLAEDEAMANHAKTQNTTTAKSDK
ncbi:hypothetical protein [Shewanella gaetbuli]